MIAVSVVGSGVVGAVVTGAAVVGARDDVRVVAPKIGVAVVG